MNTKFQDATSRLGDARDRATAARERARQAPTFAKWAAVCDITAVAAHYLAHGLLLFAGPVAVAAAVAAGLWLWLRRIGHRDTDDIQILWLLGTGWVIATAYFGPFGQLFSWILQITLWAGAAAAPHVLDNLPSSPARQARGYGEEDGDERRVLRVPSEVVVQRRGDGSFVAPLIPTGGPAPVPPPAPAPVPPPSAPVAAPAAEPVGIDPLVISKPAIDHSGEVDEAGEAINGVLGQFKVDAAVTHYTHGPTLTLYEITLGNAVKVSAVTSLQREFAYALRRGDIRILDPVPGKSAVGVEVPNRTRQFVTLGDVLHSEAAHAGRHPLQVGLGVGTTGIPECTNLGKLPHMMIAGTTGGGKSEALNAIWVSLLTGATPDQVRIMGIDPKRVEFAAYAGVPHLLTPIITEPRKALDGLVWLVEEMERRYELFASIGVRNLDQYNAAIKSGQLKDPDGRILRPLPYLVLIVDELADLMMVSSRDVEDCIVRLGQKARAAGVHMVLATQRPVVKVVTGLIKANIPARLALAVTDVANSRVILDQAGAEKLLGMGDALWLAGTVAAAVRLQCAYVPEPEIRQVVAACIAANPAAPPPVEIQPAPLAHAGEGPSPGPADDEIGDDLDLLIQAAELVISTQFGSTSMLQRKLRVGFAKAGRLMDLMESRDIVGPSEGSKARAVLAAPDDLPAVLADLRGEPVTEGV